MDLDNIVEVKETSSYKEVNRLLQDGWILLSSGHSRGEVPGYDHHSYSLGLPKEKLDSDNKVSK
jgi:hypothetical protein